MYNNDDYVGIISFASWLTPGNRYENILTPDHFCTEDMYIKGGHICIHARFVQSKNV
jgi:hypothetical protein